ncbi:MAG TPA: hypothetical protein DHV03_07680 [Alphaproteobacteria bacterium]|nr:MAG: hypothetical protein DBW67_06760 [SAR116 cluster bacterium]HCY48549.1 hypothetical protein [Alphaproteobacteria bacterium]
MQNRNPFLNDMSRMAGDVMGLAKGMRDEVEGMVRARLDDYLAREGLVSRDDVDVLHERIALLEKKLEELQQQMADSQKSAKKPSTRSRPTSKKQENSDS